MMDIDHEVLNINGIQVLKSESNNPDKGIILHLHGLPGGPHDENKPLHDMFATRGYRVFSFNYPGLWKAEGNFSLASSIKTTLSVFNHLEEYEEPIKVFAESFGGTIIVKSILNGIVPSHVFYRAPLPGLQYFTNQPQLMNQIISSFAMLIQAGVVNIEENADMNDVLGDHDLSISFNEEFSSVIEDPEIVTQHFVVTGKNDEILDYKAILEGYKGAQIKVFDNLSHNSISRSQWIELITLADIFFQK